MTDQPPETNDDNDPFSIDISVAHLARVHNYLVGGEANFSVDRALADELSRVGEDRLDGLRGVVVAVEAFVQRVVTFLAAEAGVRQFLEIGMTTPSQHDMVHDVVLRLAPDARVVYASHDPTTLAHVHVLRRNAPEGAVAHVQSPLDDPQRILRAAAATLDLDRPIAVLLPTTLNTVADGEVAQRIVNELRTAMVPGSYVVLAHLSLDIAPESTAKILAMLNAALAEAYVSRSAAEIARLLDGLDLLDPGLVPVERWPVDGAPPILASGHLVPILGAVARKP